MRAERQRRTAAGRRRGDGRRDPRASPASACSTTRPTRRTTARCSRWPATPPASKRAVLALFERAVAAIDLRAHTRRASAPRRRRRRAVRADRGRDDGRCVALARRRSARGRDTIRRAGLPLRRGGVEPGAAEPRRHPPRRVRRAGGEDGDAGMGARLRPAGAASDAPARRSSARACRSSPTTSTWRPIASTSRRRSPPRSGTAAAASASSRRWASRSRTAASCRCR